MGADVSAPGAPTPEAPLDGPPAAVCRALSTALPPSVRDAINYTKPSSKCRVLFPLRPKFSVIDLLITDQRWAVSRAVSRVVSRADSLERSVLYFCRARCRDVGPVTPTYLSPFYSGPPGLQVTGAPAIRNAMRV